METKIHWDKTYVQIVDDNRITTIFKKNVTPSTWIRLHKFVVTHYPEISGFSMRVTIVK